MKSIILGDLHRGFGYSKDQGSEELGRKIEKSQDDFFDKLLIPYMKDNNIDNIIQTGDIYEQEYLIDNRTLSSTVDLFKVKLGWCNIYAVVGNHDIYYNTTREVNSLKTLADIKNVTIWNEVSAANIDGRSFLMCPWLIGDEHEKLEKYIVKKKPDVVIGHFDIKDMPMYKNSPSQKGLHPSLFTDNVKLTISGHYHTISDIKKDNGDGTYNRLIYVGTPYGLCHNDDDDIRGFWVFDTNDLSMLFIENTISRKFTTINNIEELKKYESLDNYFVRILVNSSLPMEDAVLFRKAIDEKAPFFSKSKTVGSVSGPYVPVDDIKQDDIVARAMGGDDMYSMACTYIGVLSVSDDMKSRMISKLSDIRDEIRGKKSR